MRESLAHADESAGKGSKSGELTRPEEPSNVGFVDGVVHEVDASADGEDVWEVEDQQNPEPVASASPRHTLANAPSGPLRGLSSRTPSGVHPRPDSAILIRGGETGDSRSGCRGVCVRGVRSGLWREIGFRGRSGNGRATPARRRVFDGGRRWDRRTERRRRRRRLGWYRWNDLDRRRATDPPTGGLRQRLPSGQRGVRRREQALR